MGRKFDTRLRFVAECLNQKLTVSANAANDWYIANRRVWNMPTKLAIAEYKIWLGRDSEPDLGQMFDMAYEDSCRDACGL